MENTKIEWAHHSWSPWLGCSKVHTGCTNCYAAAMSGWLGVRWGPKGTRRKTSDDYWKKPLKWNQDALSRNTRLRVFPSLCDPFEDYRSNCQVKMLRPSEPAAMCYLRGKMFELIDRTPYLDWLLLTKRPENIAWMWPGGYRENVGLLYSASDQETLEAGIGHLFGCRDLVPVLGLSLEPLVGPMDLTSVRRRAVDEDWTFLDNVLTGFYAHKCGGCYDPGKRLDCVIVGGESGPNARPCDVEDIVRIAEHCKGASVPCFVKQDFGPKPGCQGRIPSDIWARKDFPDIMEGGE